MLDHVSLLTYLLSDILPELAQFVVQLATKFIPIAGIIDPFLGHLAASVKGALIVAKDIGILQTLKIFEANLDK